MNRTSARPAFPPAFPKGPIMDESQGPPQIGLLHLDVIDPSNFSEFERDLETAGLDLRIEARPQPGPYAALEWMIPTAVVVYIGKAYFDSFLKEAGKDHYAILKAAIGKLSARFTGKGVPTGRLYFTEGKAESEIPRYSILYSIMADLGNGYRVKLLMRNDFDATTCNAAQDAFLQFLADLHAGTLEPSTIEGLTEANPIGNMLLMAYEPADQRLHVVDPLSDKRGRG